MQKVVAPASFKARGITTEVVTVTPDIAKAWLERNDGNRRVNQGRVRLYKSDMTSGRWKLTGEPIQFSPNGRLLNGQHRLLACIEGNTNFQVVVVYGIEDDAQECMDDGANRKAQDILSFQGIHNSVRVTSSARFLVHYKRGGAIRTSGVTRSEVVAAFRAHPNITKSVGLLSASKLPRRAPISALGFLHYAAAILLHQREKADAMVAVWKSGVPSYAGDPMHIFRERLIRDETVTKADDIAWTLFYAWNMFVADETTGVFRIQRNSVDIDGLDRSML